MISSVLLINLFPFCFQYLILQLYIHIYIHARGRRARAPHLHLFFPLAMIDMYIDTRTHPLHDHLARGVCVCVYANVGIIVQI
jgi:hypothetical protein